MQPDSVVLYLMAVLVLLSYVFMKYRIKKFIFSSFNLSFFVYSFSVLISPIIFISDLCWKPFGIGSYQDMLVFSNDSIRINCIGYIIFVTSLFINEFSKAFPNRLVRVAIKSGQKMQPKAFELIYFFSLIIWVIICLKYCKGFPLLNGNRTFYLESPISPIYLFFNECIIVSTLYFVIYSIRKAKISIKAVLGCLAVALQGNRSALLITIVMPMFIVFLYSRVVIKKNRIDAMDQFSVSSVTGKKNIVMKIIFLFPLVLLLGMWVQCMRKNTNLNFSIIISEIINGNTFSDLRDGAYILKGFVNSGSNFLGGKTYLSGLISFIPSRFSNFRYMWSWGRYTTLGLFGITNHFGLRGGNAMEAYLNFGWFGVVFISLLQGVALAKLEKIFFYLFIQERIKLNEGEYIIYNFVAMLVNFFSSSSNAYNLYVVIIMLTLIVVISKFIGKKYGSKK